LDEETRAYFDQRFGQIDQRFEKIDHRFEMIDQRFGQIDQRFVDLEIKLTKRMDDFAARLEEQIRHSHTELLRAVQGFTEALRERLAAIEAQSPTVAKRLALLEERMQQFEVRYGLHPKNPPPPSQ
jgi:hypothetical protein